MFLCMEQYANIMADKKPYAVLVIVQIIFAGMAMVSKAAFNGGMSTFVFSFYRQAIATVLLLPLAIIFARETAPPLHFKLLIKIFSLSMLGYTINLNVHGIAINLTSATLATAVTNLMPVFTFILAILLRQESMSWKRLPGIAKMVGVVICLAGTIVIAFYEGPQLNSIHHHPILHRSNQNHSTTSRNNSWIIGSFLMVLVAFCWASWIVLQGMLLREYPSWIWSSALSSLFSALQCFIVAIAVETNISRWKLQWDDGLLAVTYSGVLVAGLNVYLQTLYIHKKGPVFVAMFYPLALVFTIASSSFLLGEVINLGSVLGGGLLVGGLYFVLWVKSRERKEIISDVEVAKDSDSNVEVA